MRTTLLPFPLALMAVSLPALAEDTTASSGPADPQEWSAFQDTLERYANRMQEFQADARNILDTHEADERAKISSSYGGALGRLEASEAALRRVAVARLEAFLAKYPDSTHTPDMLFRLADLYFEESEVSFLSQDAEYARLEAQLESNPTMALPPPPLKDYSRSIGIYRRLMSKYPRYENIAATHYMLAWCFSSSNAEQFDLDAARDVYLTIVDKFPASEFSNDANMRLGEYYFDLPGPRGNSGMNVPTAIAYYEVVLGDGPSGRNYEKSIYKLGWSHYKINDYDRALTYLVTLLDYSDKQFLDTGRVSDMRQEAVEYLAISYADMADRLGRTPVEMATGHLKKVGERKWQHDVVERLAQILLVQAKFDSSIEAYRYLQDKWPLDPSNPVYQNEIATIYMKMPVPDPAKSGEAMAYLANTYAEGKPWYNTNKTNPDAIAKARGYIEKSLAQVAVEILVNAKDSGEVKEFAAAADKLGEYLEKFPFSDDYNTYEWYRALALFESNQFAEAERAYLQILKNDRSQFRDGARFQLMKAREEIVRARFGRVVIGDYTESQLLQPGAVTESVVTSAQGKPITRYVVSDEHKAFIQSCDDLVSGELTDPDWQPILDRDRTALAYLPGQILFEYGRFDEARPRLLRVIELYPSDGNAALAANLIVNTYTLEGDLQQVADLTEKFKNVGSEADRRRFADLRERAMFELANGLASKGDRGAAAAAFLEFMVQFPQSLYYKDALYNAANNYDLVGKAQESNRLFERYVTDYPSDERSKKLYFRIAETYSATLELTKAISYYEQLARLFPDFEDAAEAVFNAAFFRVGIGDNAGAARAYERYSTQFPTEADAEVAYWRAGEQWVIVGEPEALDFYGRYVKRYPDKDGNHLVEAWYNTAKIYERRGDSRRAGQAWAQVQSTFASASGAALTSRTRSLAAEGALDKLTGRFESFRTVKWSGNEAKNVEILTKTKPDELKRIIDDAVLLIQTYMDYDTTSAALYLQGMVYFAYADMVYEIPAPKALSEEEIDVYRQAVDEQFRIPSEDRGKARLSAAIEKARGEKRWTEWHTKALVALNARYPSDFPAERKETRGASTGTGISLAGPESLSSAPAVAPGGGQ